MVHEPSSAASDPVNPYAVSSLAEPGAAAEVTPTQVARSYALRMDWGDRQRFLRAVGPLRLFAVIGGITGTVGLFGLLGSSVSRAIRFSDFTLLARAIVQGAAYVALVYTQWLHWRLAGAIAATAGGTTPKMQDWSEVQLRLIWVAVMYLVLYLLEWTVEWGIFFLNRVNSL